MIYLLLLIVLFALEIFYFKIANHFNIIDKPNERSSHNTVTLRGGGLIFYIAALAYFIISGFDYPWFFLALTMMTIISFLDDVFTLSNKVRLLVHFSSVLLMAYQLDLFEMPWYFLITGFIVVVGVINAYNFMDGINGITACYSLSVGGLLILANREIDFIDPDFLYCVMLGVLVFAFYNFRNKARCFAGDVGSVSIAFILIFAIGLLVLKTGNLIYILFLTVYGIDTVWTIFSRLIKKENIFKAHRSHLYQYLANEAGVNKLLISFLYGLIQFIIGVAILYISHQEGATQIIFTFALLALSSAVYLWAKNYIVQRFVLVKN